MTQDGGLSSLMGNRNQRSCVREWSSSRLVGDSETDIHRRLDAFLTHWMQARSIGPNCGGSDGFGTSAHLIADLQWSRWRTQLPENAMRNVDPPRREFPPRWMASPRWPLISIVVCAVLLAVVLTVFRTKLRALDIFSAFLLFGAAAFSVLIVLYTRSLRRAQQVQLDTEERLQQMADNIQEIFWMIDAKTKKALYVTEAYETITGHSCQSLLENPSSYEELIHPEDRVHVLAKLGEATQTGHFDERFRIVRPRGEVRWVTVHGFPVRDAAGTIHRLVGTARDVTAQKEAEDKVAEHLADSRVRKGGIRCSKQSHSRTDRRSSDGLCFGQAA